MSHCAIVLGRASRRNKRRKEKGKRKDCHEGIGTDATRARSTSRAEHGFLRRTGVPRGARVASSLVTVSPYWYIRGGPHAAVSDVGDPRERQALLRVHPLVSADVLATPAHSSYVRLTSPDSCDCTLPTPKRANTIARASLRGRGPLAPRCSSNSSRAASGWASALYSFFGTCSSA